MSAFGVAYVLGAVTLVVMLQNLWQRRIPYGTRMRLLGWFWTTAFSVVVILLVAELVTTGRVTFLMDGAD